MSRERFLAGFDRTPEGILTRRLFFALDATPNDARLDRSFPQLEKPRFEPTLPRQPPGEPEFDGTPPGLFTAEAAPNRSRSAPGEHRLVLLVPAPKSEPSQDARTRRQRPQETSKLVTAEAAPRLAASLSRPSLPRREEVSTKDCDPKIALG